MLMVLMMVSMRGVLRLLLGCRDCVGAVEVGVGIVSGGVVGVGVGVVEVVGAVNERKTWSRLREKTRFKQFNSNRKTIK